MNVKTIAVIGTGYVGLSTGACLAEVGHKVICVDKDENIINTLNAGNVSIFEYGLQNLIGKNINKNLEFTCDIKKAVKNSEVIFIAVGTPPQQDGSADLSAIKSVANSIAENINGYKVVVTKSTVPVGTGELLEKFLKENMKKHFFFDIASVPEFLREGNAVHDTFYPDRIVLGVKTRRAEKILTEVYEPFKTDILVTDIKSAEIIKLASNSFLAMKISYINSVALLCEKAGADIENVATGLGKDKRIGRAFLNAGIGYGGFCFPKDLDSFLTISEKYKSNFPILKAVKETNLFMREHFVNKIDSALEGLAGKNIAVLGLSFKPQTDDIRESPAIDVIRTLVSKGAKVTAYDPQAIKKAKKVVKNIDFAYDVYEAVEGKDCIAIITEWNEFKQLDLLKLKKLLKKPVIIDGRNMFNPVIMKKKGFRYYSIGR